MDKMDKTTSLSGLERSSAAPSASRSASAWPWGKQSSPSAAPSASAAPVGPNGEHLCPLQADYDKLLDRVGQCKTPNCDDKVEWYRERFDLSCVSVRCDLLLAHCGRDAGRP